MSELPIEIIPGARLVEFMASKQLQVSSFQFGDTQQIYPTQYAQLRLFILKFCSEIIVDPSIIEDKGLCRAWDDFCENEELLFDGNAAIDFRDLPDVSPPNYASFYHGYWWPAGDPARLTYIKKLFIKISKDLTE